MEHFNKQFFDFVSVTGLSLELCITLIGLVCTFYTALVCISVYMYNLA